jgi:uncharacterized membrane protein
MIPEPLHPAVVHFPIVLMFVFSVFAVIATLRTARRPNRRMWVAPTLLAAALALAAYVSVRTGEAQEERVEQVVLESRIEAHEENAELFMRVAFIALAAALLGFVRGKIGNIARFTASVASLVLIGVGILVGSSGGELVYRHGAAQVYTDTQSGASQP